MPAGVDQEGKPELVSLYPKMTISMRPGTKARLEAASTLTRLPAWRIIDRALEQYMETASPEDRKAIDGIADRMQTRIPA
jgi:hypothetical protein